MAKAGVQHTPKAEIAGHVGQPAASDVAAKKAEFTAAVRQHYTSLMATGEYVGREAAAAAEAVKCALVSWKK